MSQRSTIGKMEYAVSQQMIEIKPVQRQQPQLGCCCHVEPEPRPGTGSGTGQKNRELRVWLRLGISLVLAGQSMVFGLALNISDEKPVPGSLTYWGTHGALILAALTVVALLGRPLFSELFRALRSLRITVESLFVLSLCGAFLGSLVSTLSGEGSIYYEVVTVVLIVYTFGKLIGARSRQKVLNAADRLREDFAQAWVLADGKRHRIAVRELCLVNSSVSIYPGEPVTVDGRILSGEGFVSETSLTGEPTPVVRRKGDRVLAGSYSVDATLVVRPEKLEGERQLDEVLESVERGRIERPSELQVQADRIIRWFLPLVVSVSAGTFLFWLTMSDTPWWQALFNSMAVLLVACPCALGLATPIAVWGGLQRFSQLGLIAQSGRILDSLAATRVVIFDKTGTLSEEDLALVDVVTRSDSAIERTWLLDAISTAEAGLAHPVARAIRSRPASSLELVSRELIPGQGLRALVGGRELLIGDLSLFPGMEGQFDKLASESLAANRSGWKKVVYVTVDGEPAAAIILDERLRGDTSSVLTELRNMGLEMQVLTGDPNPRWQDIDGVQVISGLSAAEKVSRLQSLAESGDVLFVGDGINDASAMAAARGAIAMGSGAGLTRSTADAVLPGDNLSAIPAAINIARRVRAGVHGNMLFALTYNGIGMSLAAAGLLHPVVAALLMVVSSSLVSFRSLRSAAA